MLVLVFWFFFFSVSAHTLHMGILLWEEDFCLDLFAGIPLEGFEKEVGNSNFMSACRHMKK